MVSQRFELINSGYAFWDHKLRLMKKSQCYSYQSPIGQLDIELAGNTVTRLLLDSIAQANKTLNDHHPDIASELDNFFTGNKKTLDTPISLSGTPFQKKVWQALANIPYGKTMTYKQVAEQCGTHPRAIGMACRTNPIPLMIPCHRVVGQKGLVGFMGQTKGHGLSIKEWLLNHEIRHT